MTREQRWRHRLLARFLGLSGGLRWLGTDICEGRHQRLADALPTGRRPRELRDGRERERVRGRRLPRAPNHESRVARGCGRGGDGGVEGVDRLERRVRARIVVFGDTTEVLREALDDERVGQVLCELAAGLHVERVAGVEGRVEHVGGMRALGEGEFDRVLLVGLSSPVITFIELKPSLKMLASCHSKSQRK